MEKNNTQSNIVVFGILAMIVTASAISFYRYCYTLEYLIYLHIECDPALTVCTTDDESYYSKNTVAAYDIEKYCSETQGSACLAQLREMSRLTEILPCEDNLEEWESCTDPAEYVAEVDTAHGFDTEVTAPSEGEGEEEGSPLTTENTQDTEAE